MITILNSNKGGTMSIPSQTEYHHNEMQRFFKKMERIEKAPLSERREARNDWKEALEYKQNIARNCSWLLDGSYGYGEMIRAHSLISGGGNKAARLGILLAALDHNCPATFAVSAFKCLTAEQQEAVSEAINEAIQEYLTEQTEEKTENESI